MSRNSREAERCKAELTRLRKRPEYKFCADCGGKQPTWCSTNIGVMVCIRCSGVHRQMGTHISKVKSTTLDAWNDKLLSHFKAQGGNEILNQIYEHKMPSSRKPTPDSDMHVLERFIRDKYEHRNWYSAKKARKLQRDLEAEQSESDESDAESSDDDDDSDASDYSDRGHRSRRRSRRSSRRSSRKSSRKNKKNHKSRRSRTPETRNPQPQPQRIPAATQPPPDFFNDDFGDAQFASAPVAQPTQAVAASATGFEDDTWGAFETAFDQQPNQVTRQPSAGFPGAQPPQQFPPGGSQQPDLFGFGEMQGALPDQQQAQQPPQPAPPDPAKLEQAKKNILGQYSRANPQTSFMTQLPGMGVPAPGYPMAPGMGRGMMMAPGMMYPMQPSPYGAYPQQPGMGRGMPMGGGMGRGGMPPQMGGGMGMGRGMPPQMGPGMGRGMAPMGNMGGGMGRGGFGGGQPQPSPGGYGQPANMGGGGGFGGGFGGGNPYASPPTQPSNPYQQQASSGFGF